jgi:hypothetical protein
MDRPTLSNPETAEEWQAAVDAADFVLALESCRQYGLIEWKGKVNLDRCFEILDQGRRLGYTPADRA